MKKYPLIIGGQEVLTEETHYVYDKYTGEVFAEISAAGREEVDRAVDRAVEAFETNPLDAASRYTILMKAADLMEERADEIAAIMTAEAGKPTQDARNEILWSTDLVRESAELARQLHGECFGFWGDAWMDTRTCYTRREPVGPVAAIAPFNYPLNLVIHKVAPAIAAGNPVILKPAEVTSVTGLAVCRIFMDAGLPDGYISCLTGSGSVIGPLLTENQKIAFYSFTGSVSVGKSIKAAIGLRRCAMELGSNSATIVCRDYDPAAAAAACADAAFTNAGQVCIHLQRLYVDRAVYDEFLEKLIREAEAITVGDPRDPGTRIGPMIAEKEAARVENWVREAVEQGAVIQCGGKRSGALFRPTVLTGTTPDMKVMKDEVFGPLVCVVPFDTIDEAFTMVNDSRYGLNSGILTNDIATGMEASRRLKTGSVIIGGTCGFRIGNMPYGGVKESGFGKEGPRYAIEEMTDLKAVVILN
ncbi:MAG: aldehyde dehydrogenase family protein [Lachnospiraceae bacterium]|nr:aldehyde dehydrogenase family protein [Lachnospiraceae bacterium]